MVNVPLFCTPLMALPEMDPPFIVNVPVSLTFTPQVTWPEMTPPFMTGGSISGNTATERGGGVGVYGTFTKTGGTISGSDAGNGNKASNGAAVFVGTWNGSSFINVKLKNTTSGPDDNLSFNASNGAFSGAWD